MAFSPLVKNALWGEPFQGVAADVIPPTVDGRAAALRIFKAYLQEITFFRSGGTDDDGRELPAIPFRIPARDIHDEWPENEPDLHLPAIALLSQAPANYDTPGLNSNVIEDSFDQFAPNTVLSVQGEYVEQFPVEVWCKTKSERRAMKLGIESALSPNQQMAGLRFKMAEYYDRLATLTLQSCEVLDDEQATFARRKLRFVISLSYLQVRLVKVPPMTPVPEFEVLSPDEIDVEEPREEPPESS